MEIKRPYRVLGIVVFLLALAFGSGYLTASLGANREIDKLTADRAASDQRYAATVYTQQLIEQQFAGTRSALDRAQSANQDLTNQLAESRKRAGELADQISAIGSAVTGVASLGKTISSGSDGDLELARLIAAESQAVKDRVRRLQNINSEGTGNN